MGKSTNQLDSGVPQGARGLREQLGGKRLRLNDDQRRRLAAKAGRRSCALAKDSSEACRTWICKPHDLKQIDLLDTTRA